MSSHITNSSSSSSSASSVPRIGFATAKPHIQELKMYLILCSLPECIGRTSIVLSGERDIDDWFSQPAVKRAFHNWMVTTPHNVVGPRTDEIVENVWYCDSPEKRYVRLTLEGRRIGIMFFTRATNPDLVPPSSKEYVLGIM